MSETRKEINYGPWVRDNGQYNEIRRDYHFKNFAGPGTTSKVTVCCRLTLNGQNIEPFVYLVFDPYLLEQTTFGAAIFGPPDELLDYRVLTAKIEAAATGISFVVFDQSDGPHLVDLLLLGCELHLNLLTERQASIAKVPLHNDETFAVEYYSLEASLLDAVDDSEIDDDDDEPGRKVAPKHAGFSVNEFVVYPAHGVGQILAIEEQEIAGAKLELFVINFIKDKMTLRVPTSKIANVGMRKLSEPALVKKALETVKSAARIGRTEWTYRAQEYEAKINSGDIVAIAEVVRDLQHSDARPERSSSERQLYEAALDRLSREIAAVQHITETEAVKEIEAALAKGPRRGSKVAETGEAPAMFTAKIFGVIPRGMNLGAAPVNTKAFASLDEAKAWLLGPALRDLPTPVNNIEIVSPTGERVFNEWHWSHDALKKKNEDWWDTREPNRHKEREERIKRKRAIEAGLIPDDELSMAERFERDNPLWRGPFFAWLPTQTVDEGTIWFKNYWVRHTGLKFVQKLFPDPE